MTLIRPLRKESYLRLCPHPFESPLFSLSFMLLTLATRARRVLFHFEQHQRRKTNHLAHNRFSPTHLSSCRVCFHCVFLDTEEAPGRKQDHQRLSPLRVHQGQVHASERGRRRGETWQLPVLCGCGPHSICECVRNHLSLPVCLIEPKCTF